MTMLGPSGEEGRSLNHRNIRVRLEAHLIQTSPLTEGKLESQQKRVNCPKPYRALVAEKG